MSIYTDVTKIPGYNQTQYDTLVNKARSEGVDKARIDQLLLDAVNEGKNFTEAIQQVTSQIPTLKKAASIPPAFLGEWTALPAPGTVIMAMVTEIAAKNRQQNKELMWAQTEAIASSMEEQADTMKTMAWTQFTISCFAAVGGIIGGAAGGNMTGAGLVFGSISQAVNSGSQFAGTLFQAEIKEMDADQERMRAMRDSLKDLNDGLKDLIQKSLSGADSIQQGRNQAMGRILV